LFYALEKVAQGINANLELTGTRLHHGRKILLQCGFTNG
jgi:hypothetical protein